MFGSIKNFFQNIVRKINIFRNFAKPIPGRGKPVAISFEDLNQELKSLEAGPIVHETYASYSVHEVTASYEPQEDTLESSAPVIVMPKVEIYPEESIVMEEEVIEAPLHPDTIIGDIVTGREIVPSVIQLRAPENIQVHVIETNEAPKGEKKPRKRATTTKKATPKKTAKKSTSSTKTTATKAKVHKPRTPRVPKVPPEAMGFGF